MKILDSPNPNSIFPQWSPGQQMVPHSQNCLHTLLIKPRLITSLTAVISISGIFVESICFFPSRLPPSWSEPSLFLLTPLQWLSNLSSGFHYCPLQSVYSPHCRQKDLFKIEITLHQSLRFSMLPINRIPYTLKSLTWPTGLS